MTRLFGACRTSASRWAVLGADAALEAADIILMEDEPSKIIKCGADRKRNDPVCTGKMYCLRSV